MDDKFKMPKKSRKSIRTANRKIRAAAELDAGKLEEGSTSSQPDVSGVIAGTVSQHATFGLLYPTNDHQCPLPDDDRENGFFVFVDIENLQKDLPPAFDLRALRSMVKKALQNRYGQSCKVIRMTTIGNMTPYRSKSASKQKPENWFGMVVQDVYPRNGYCDFPDCGVQFHFAVSHLRPAVNYERSFDIADDLLQEAMFMHVENYGVPINFLVITGDGDFAGAMRLLKARQVQVYLAKPENCNSELERAASNMCSFDFREVVNLYRGGKSPRR